MTIFNPSYWHCRRRWTNGQSSIDRCADVPICVPILPLELRPSTMKERDEGKVDRCGHGGIDAGDVDVKEALISRSGNDKFNFKLIFQNKKSLKPLCGLVPPYQQPIHTATVLCWQLQPKHIVAAYSVVAAPSGNSTLDCEGLGALVEALFLWRIRALWRKNFDCHISPPKLTLKSVLPSNSKRHQSDKMSNLAIIKTNPHISAI